MPYRCGLQLFTKVKNRVRGVKIVQMRVMAMCTDRCPFRFLTSRCDGLRVQTPDAVIE